jgi:hypothetical protein
MKRTILQVVITKDLLFDFKKYCTENDLKYTDVVRSLIRMEVYQLHDFAKRDKNGMDRWQKEEYKKWKRLKNKTK